MSDGHDADCGCAASTASQSTTQTLGELEWERGIWNAALNGETSRVGAMLERDRALRDARDGSGYTALHYAARAGNAKVVAMLLAAGADPNAVTCSGGASPLHRAAYMGHEECVEMLLRHGADPLLKDLDGNTALQKAVGRGHERVASVMKAAASTKR